MAYNGLAMHSNFNDLKTKTMEYKELVKHHTQLIKDQNENKWEVIETSDLEEICETYHQAKLKLLGIGDVSQQRELLAFRKWQKDNWKDVYLYSDEFMISEFKKANCG